MSHDMLYGTNGAIWNIANMNRAAALGLPPLFDGLAPRMIQLREGQDLSISPTGDLYWVLSGVVQNSVIAEDGRRWIEGFHLPGEFFWADQASVRSQTAEALCATSILITASSVLEALTSSCDSAVESVWSWCARTHVASLRRGFLLARSTAVEKLSYFLMDLVHRLGGRREICLLMSRAEIGDHLGLTSETVTRTFTLLQNENLLRVNGKDVTILDSNGLALNAQAIFST